jgi:hypothetical protein
LSRFQPRVVQPSVHKPIRTREREKERETFQSNEGEGVLR